MSNMSFSDICLLFHHILLAEPYTQHLKLVPPLNKPKVTSQSEEEEEEKKKKKGGGCI